MTAEMSRALIHIDESLRELDHSWKALRPLDVRKLVDAVRREASVHDWVDLLAADLEWRLRLAPAGFRLPPPTEIATDDREGWGPKRIEAYLREFPEIAEDSAAMRGLVEAKFIALSRWNAPPKIADFVDRFARLSELETTLRQALDEVQRLWVVVLDQGCEKFQWLSTGQIELGRQSRDEPPAPCLLRGGKRLVVVNCDHKKVSRQQAVVTRTALATIELTNTSKILAMNVAGEKLLPGETIQANLPTIVGIHKTQLRLQLAT
jgi:hypothetical protein